MDATEITSVNADAVAKSDSVPEGAGVEAVYCPSCGTRNRADAVFCNGCGQRLDVVAQTAKEAPTQETHRSFYNYPEDHTSVFVDRPERTEGVAPQSTAMPILSFVLGLFSLLLSGTSTLDDSWVSIPTLVMGIAGVVLASLVKKRGQRSGLATAGKVLSIIGIVVSAMVLCVFLQRLHYYGFYGFYY